MHRHQSSAMGAHVRLVGEVGSIAVCLESLLELTSCHQGKSARSSKDEVIAVRSRQDVKRGPRLPCQREHVGGIVRNPCIMGHLPNTKGPRRSAGPVFEELAHDHGGECDWPGI